MALSIEDYHLIWDSADYILNATIEMPLHQQIAVDGEMSNASSCLDFYYYSLEANPQISVATDVMVHDSSSSLDNGSNAPSSASHFSCLPVQVEPHNDKILKLQASLEKKRKYNESSSITAQSKDKKETRAKKLRRRPSGELKVKEEKKPKVDGLKSSKSSAEPPVDYIHVRARRGQATDSHSLAERVRREKISERMNILQGLVPGCDRMTGKALILDEIINYVKSLQNQVEFLSMKLASMNSPISYDFGMDFDGSCMPQPMPSFSETNSFQLTASGHEINNNYQLMNHSGPFLFQEKGPTSLSQDGSSFLQKQGSSISWSSATCALFSDE